MNDAMNIRKVFSSVSPTQRVHRLKKEQSHSKKRNFERDLGEEKESDQHERQNAPIPETAITRNEKEKREQRNFKEKSADSKTDAEKCNRKEAVGALVDIRI